MPPDPAVTRRHLLAQMAGALALAGTAHAAEPGAAEQNTAKPGAPNAAGAGKTPDADAGEDLPPKISPLSPVASAKLIALPGKAVLGDRRALSMVTELVDYNAPHWRRSANDMRALLAGDATLGYTIVQTPRFDVRSLEAARVSLAMLAKDRDRFEAFYLALAESTGPVDGPSALDAAGRLGIDRYTLFNVSIQPENTQALTQAVAFASAAGVLATPAYVIGEQVIEGYIDLARKRALIAAARG